MSWAVWITGPPGSGKTAIARAAAEGLREAGVPVEIVELDAMRKLVTPAPTYSDVERAVVYRALVWVAAALVDAGVNVLIDATGHRREWRDLARATIPRFAEVQLTCSLETCRAREAARHEGSAPRGIYARAGRPGATVPGVDVPYERALAAALEIDTEATPVAAAAEQVAALALSLDAGGGAEAGAGWAIWITGLPGSGKTTLAFGVAEQLARRGVRVKVLELADLRAFVLGGGVPATAASEEIVHRALVYAARRLTDAGVPVIVDATAPRRAWRDLARELIAHFAEVQLLCPREVCDTRERAVRWGLVAYPPAVRAGDAPDIVLDYEPALRAEVTVHTDAQDPWSAIEAVLRLVRRLAAAAATAPLEVTEIEWEAP